MKLIFTILLFLYFNFFSKSNSIAYCSSSNSNTILYKIVCQNQKTHSEIAFPAQLQFVHFPEQTFSSKEEILQYLEANSNLTEITVTDHTIIGKIDPESNKPTVEDVTIINCQNCNNSEIVFVKNSEQCPLHVTGINLSVENLTIDNTDLIEAINNNSQLLQQLIDIHSVDDCEEI